MFSQKWKLTQHERSHDLNSKIKCSMSNCEKKFQFPYQAYIIIIIAGITHKNSFAGVSI